MIMNENYRQKEIHFSRKHKHFSLNLTENKYAYRIKGNGDGLNALLAVHKGASDAMAAPFTSF